MSVLFRNSLVKNIEVNPHIIRDDSLILFLDAGNNLSYPGSGNTWFDMTDNENNATINGATYSNGIMSFDGSNDSLSFGSNFSIDVANGFTFWFCWDLPSQSSGAWNYFLYHNPSNSHKYEFGQYGTGANTFHWKDNISYAGTAATRNIGNGYAAFAFGTTSDGHTFSSVEGENKVVKNPGSNSHWGTSPTTNMVFNSIFTGAGSYLAANVRMILLYNRELTNAELAQNFLVSQAKIS